MMKQKKSGLFILFVIVIFSAIFLLNGCSNKFKNVPFVNADNLSQKIADCVVAVDTGVSVYDYDNSLYNQHKLILSDTLTIYNLEVRWQKYENQDAKQPSFQIFIKKLVFQTSVCFKQRLRSRIIPWSFLFCINHRAGLVLECMEDYC